MTHTTHERRTAIGTGGPRGIGVAVAGRPARDGLAVAVIDPDTADGADTVSAVTVSGGSAPAVAADVADESAVAATVARESMEPGPPTVPVHHVVSPGAGFVPGRAVHVNGGPVAR
ncbi:SDR family NAD(P)-dependent oxidoreductase [Streptomyces sp. NPDC002004]